MTYFFIGILLVFVALVIFYRSIKAFPESFKDGMALWFFRLGAYLFVGGGTWVAMLLFLLRSTFIYVSL